MLAGVAFETARRHERPENVALLLGLTRIGVALVGIGTVLAGGFGLWLVHLGDWGYGSAWVDTSMALFLVRRSSWCTRRRTAKKARLLATLAADHVPHSDELTALLERSVAPPGESRFVAARRGDRGADVLQAMIAGVAVRLGGTGCPTPNRVARET